MNLIRRKWRHAQVIPNALPEHRAPLIWKDYHKYSEYTDDQHGGSSSNQDLDNSGMVVTMLRRRDYGGDALLRGVKSIWDGRCQSIPQHDHTGQIIPEALLAGHDNLQPAAW
jgi:hypothetical protein